jgi:hypothetical protein
MQGQTVGGGCFATSPVVRVSSVYPGDDGYEDEQFGVQFGAFMRHKQQVTFFIENSSSSSNDICDETASFENRWSGDRA